MKRSKKIPNPPRKCIFCGKGPISREHVWAKWMRDYLPRGQAAQFIHEADFENSTQRSRPGPLNRKGDARSQKLKVACVDCNTKWMSVLQDQTRPILLPLLLREDKALTPQEQEALASWLTMFTMVYGTTVPDYAADTIEQREAFKRDKKAPLYWRFWCAPFDGQSSPAIQTGVGLKNRDTCHRSA
jgi:hypothetical protein